MKLPFVTGLVVTCTLFTLESPPSAAARRSSHRVAGDPGGHTGKGVAAARKKDYETADGKFTKAIDAQNRDPKN
ncbi:MAG: hypothetical protein ACR2HH_06815 [Chthoniobacterales bacterium]